MIPWITWGCKLKSTTTVISTLSKTKWTQQGKLLHNSGNVTTQNNRIHKNVECGKEHWDSLADMQSPWSSLYLDGTVNECHIQYAEQDTGVTYSSTLKMKATYSSKMSVHFERTTWCYIPEDSILHNHRCKKLKSYINFVYGTSVKVKLSL
jgi:hypothetical protein